MRYILALFLSSVLAYPATVHQYGVKGDGMHDDTLGLQAAIADSQEVLLPPGTYMVSRPLVLPSGFWFHGSGMATILEKAKAYSHVFVNAAAPNHGTNFDESIRLSDFMIDCAGNGTQVGAAEMTANGHIQFSYCTGIQIERVKLVNGDPTLYAIHLQNVTNASLSHVTLQTEKDGIHIGPGCESVGIYDSSLTTGDDAIAIMPEDYPRTQNRCDDIVNITVRNVSLRHPPGHPYGAGIGFYVGSWTNWAVGNTYRLGDKAVFRGNVYKSVVQGTNIARMPPTHTTFTDVRGPDGITWRWLQSGTKTSANVKNVLLQGIWSAPTTIIHYYGNDPQYNDAVYPGTEGTANVTGLSSTNVN